MEMAAKKHLQLRLPYKWFVETATRLRITDRNVKSDAHSIYKSPRLVLFTNNAVKARIERELDELESNGFIQSHSY